MSSALLLFSELALFFLCLAPVIHLCQLPPPCPLSSPESHVCTFIGAYDPTKTIWFYVVETGHLGRFSFFSVCREVLNSVGRLFPPSPSSDCTVSNVLKGLKQPMFKDTCLSFQITKKLVKGSAEKDKMKLQRVRHFP